MAVHAAVLEPALVGFMQLCKVHPAEVGTMSSPIDRRKFLKSTAAVGAAFSLGPSAAPTLAAEKKASPLFKISLAQWSLHRTLFDGKLDNLDFPAFTKKEFGIAAVEYVNQFFKDKANDAKYLKDLKQRAADHGITNVLIMIDDEGALGDPDESKRKEAVENHHKWVEAAKFLGCHSIRVNARSEGSYDEQMKLAADGLRRLTEFGAKHDISVIVENHGGLSSNGAWLAGVMKLVDNKRCGTLPDFGNFKTGPDEWYDRYKGVKELMPYAKGVSAKSHEFDADGNEVRTDYVKMVKIVLDAGYHGYIGIEWEGETPSEVEGVKLTKNLLEKVRDRLARDYPSF
jgi:sugar phosphate isomerase/epimerase